MLENVFLFAPGQIPACMPGGGRLDGSYLGLVLEKKGPLL